MLDEIRHLFQWLQTLIDTLIIYVGQVLERCIDSEGRELPEEGKWEFDRLDEAHVTIENGHCLGVNLRVRAQNSTAESPWAGNFVHPLQA